MAPSRLWPELASSRAIAIGAIGALGVACSAPAPPPAQEPTDADLLSHAWVIESHVLSESTTLTDADADEYYTRKIRITERSYKSPFQGTCENAARRKREVLLVDVALALDLSAKTRKRLVKYGLGKDLVEFALSCGPETRVPAITMYVAGDRAMTCFAGVCYLLSRP